MGRVRLPFLPQSRVYGAGDTGPDYLFTPDNIPLDGTAGEAESFIGPTAVSELPAKRWDARLLTGIWSIRFVLPTTWPNTTHDAGLYFSNTSRILFIASTGQIRMYTGAYRAINQVELDYPAPGDELTFRVDFTTLAWSVQKNAEAPVDGVALTRTWADDGVTTADTLYVGITPTTSPDFLGLIYPATYG